MGILSIIMSSCYLGVACYLVIADIAKKSKKRAILHAICLFYALVSLFSLSLAYVLEHY